MNYYLRNNTVQPLIGRQPLLIPLFSSDDINSKQQRKLRKNDESFHNIIKPMITVSQFFGNFPINGIQDSKPDEYVFKFTSFITFYSLMIITLFGCNFVLLLFETIKAINFTKEKFFIKLLIAVFIGYNFFVQLIIFCKLPSWIKLQINWQQVEGKLDNFHRTKFRLRFKLQKITLIVFLPALIEHIYSYVDPISQTTSAEEYFSGYSEYTFLTIFESLDGISNNYKIFAGIICSIIRTMATFTWNFCDLLIIMVSIGLAGRYKQLNEIVSYKIICNSTDGINWRKIKEKYAIMNELVKEADNIVSPLVLLSCIMNVYMICVQTSDGIRSVTTEGNIAIYHFLSLFSIVLRTMAVVLSAARIDDESGHALSIFARCHPSVFIIEVIWMQQKLSIDRVSSTAMKFFPITRKFLLTITGTIITYEIVYMQLRAVH